MSRNHEARDYPRTKKDSSSLKDILQRDIAYNLRDLPSDTTRSTELEDFHLDRNRDRILRNFLSF